MTTFWKSLRPTHISSKATYIWKTLVEGNYSTTHSCFLDVITLIVTMMLSQAFVSLSQSSPLNADESLHLTESYKTTDLQKFRSPTWIFLAKEYLFSTVTLNQCRYCIIKPNGRMSACKLKIIGKLECDVSKQLLIAWLIVVTINHQSVQSHLDDLFIFRKCQDLMTVRIYLIVD